MLEEEVWWEEGFATEGAYSGEVGSFKCVWGQGGMETGMSLSVAIISIGEYASIIPLKVAEYTIGSKHHCFAN